MLHRISHRLTPAHVASLALCFLLTTALPTATRAQSARFEQFTVTSPKAGEMAPDFSLLTMDNEPFHLMEVVVDKPVVIEFGSFT